MSAGFWINENFAGCRSAHSRPNIPLVASEFMYDNSEHSSVLALCKETLDLGQQSAQRLDPRNIL